MWTRYYDAATEAEKEEHNIQFGGYDVETLVIWANPLKQKMKWTEPIALEK